MTIFEESEALRAELINKEKREISGKLWDFIKKFPRTNIQSWISGSITQEAIIFAEFFGRYVAYEGLTTSQIRNFFGEVKRIEMNSMKNLELTSIRMLLPKLAYAAARAEKEGTNKLKDVLTYALSPVIADNLDEKTTKHRFKNFSNFFEAILAYHKSFGGK